MKRYVEFTNAKGRLVRQRIYCTSEAALERTLSLLGVDRRALIEEGATAASPPQPAAVVEPAKKKPARRRVGRPLEVEIESHPSDLRGDPTGGKLDWMICEEGEPVKKSTRRENMEKAAQIWRTKHVLKASVEQGGGYYWKRIEDALIEGALDLARPYSMREIMDRTGISQNSGEMLSLALYENTPFRMVLVPATEQSGWKVRQWRFENKPSRHATAA